MSALVIFAEPTMTPPKLALRLRDAADRWTRRRSNRVKAAVTIEEVVRHKRIVSFRGTF
jgi:hypothetical protein